MKYDVFISYSRKDYVDEHKNIILGNEVSKIRQALADAEISYWIDEKGVIPGEDYAAKITKHIKACKIFLYISSKAANESEWTRKEVATALLYNKYIVPLLLDNSPFHDSVILRIADLDRIDYYVNPQLGLDKLVRSIKTFLEETAKEGKRKKEEENKKKEEEQRRKQLEEELRSEIIKMEVERATLEKSLLQKKLDLEKLNGKQPFVGKETQKEKEDVGFNKSKLNSLSSSYKPNEKKILYDHFSKIEQSNGKEFGIVPFFICLAALVIIVFVSKWFKLNDSWWYVPTIISLSLVGIADLIVFIRYSNVYDQLKLSKEQEDEFAEQYRREKEEYEELIRKEKLGLLAEEGRLKLDEIKAVSKKREKWTEPEEMGCGFVALAIIIMWISFWINRQTVSFEPTIMSEQEMVSDSVKQEITPETNYSDIMEESGEQLQSSNPLISKEDFQRRMLDCSDYTLVGSKSKSKKNYVTQAFQVIVLNSNKEIDGDFEVTDIQDVRDMIMTFNKWRGARVLELEYDSKGYVKLAKIEPIY